MILVGFQYRESVLLILEEMVKTHGLFDAPRSILEVFHFPPVISYSIPLLSHLIIPLSTVLSIYPIGSSSSSKSGSAKQPSDNPQPHVFETFCFNKDYEAFQKQVILPLICDSCDHQYIYYSDKPALPLLVSFAPSQSSQFTN
jgi:hypothetical protein